MRNYRDRVHSSLHTTFNVLENLRIAAGHRREAVLQCERRAVELMLEHRVYRSDHTGEVISQVAGGACFAPPNHIS